MATTRTQTATPISRIVVRLAVLSAIGALDCAGLSPDAAALFVALVGAELAGAIGQTHPLDRLRPAALRDLDGSALAARWTSAHAAAARASATAEVGRTAFLGRLWQKCGRWSATLARALPFLLLGILGGKIQHQAGLITLLVAVYPFLEWTRYHEALNRARRGR